MKQVIDTKIKLLSPLHTGSDEVSGIDRSVRRREYIVNGETLLVPIVSANSIRGILRRVLANDYLQLLGIGDAQIDPKLYYMLFAGGALEKATGTIDIGGRREIFENIPLLHLMGSAIGNAILPGTLIVEDCIPICEELKDFTGIDSDISIWEIVSEEFGTRRDDYPHKDEVETDKHQMLYRYEVIKAGAEMTFRFALLSVATEMDEMLLRRGVSLLLKEARLGGKGAVGLGKVEAYNIEGVDTSDYEKYIQERKEEILKFFDDRKLLRDA